MLSVSRKFTNSQGERESDFINIVAWRQLGDNCDKFLSKGKKAAVVGALQIRTYDDKDGKRCYVTEIVADEVQFLSPNTSQEGDTPPPQSKRNASELTPVEDDGLPF